MQSPGNRLQVRLTRTPVHIHLPDLMGSEVVAVYMPPINSSENKPLTCLQQTLPVYFGPGRRVMYLTFLHQANTQPVDPPITIRKATEADAPGLVAILQGIAAERIHSAIDVVWPVEKQRMYLASLSVRETVHIAIARSGHMVGFQVLDLWAPTISSMQHVAQIGTFLIPEWRRRGVGRLLFKTTEEFARSAGYTRMLAQVRASNDPAKTFYRRLGFRACGRLARQVRIDDVEDDEILMELFLS